MNKLEQVFQQKADEEQTWVYPVEVERLRSRKSKTVEKRWPLEN